MFARLRRPNRQFGIITVLSISLCIISYYRLTPSLIQKDALQNNLMAYHLADKGIISLDGNTPSNFREPLPIILTAAYWKIYKLMPDETSTSDFLNKNQYPFPSSSLNILYLFVTLIFSALILKHLHIHFRLIIIGIVCIWGFAGNHLTHLNSFTSEFMAMMWMSVSAFLILKLYEYQTAKWSILLGLSLGCFTLTKGAGLYVIIMLLAGLLFVVLIGKNKKWLPQIALSAITFLLILAPWAIRNYIHFHKLSLTQRSDLVLLTRAFKNQMTPAEYSGAFYVYSPAAVGELFFEKGLGFSKSEMLEGGPYERLVRHQPGDSIASVIKNPNLAVSFYVKAALTQTQMLDSGKTTADVKRLALEMIRSNPIKHIATSIPFAYRGIWSFPGHSHLSVMLLNLISFLCLLISPIVAIRSRNPNLFLLTILPFLYFGFHAATTHFIPRYSFPVIPVAIICLVIFANHIIHQIIHYFLKSGMRETGYSNTLL